MTSRATQEYCFQRQLSITREKCIFMTFDPKHCDCRIFLIFAVLSAQSSGLDPRWTSHRLLLWVLDYLLFFLAWILLSMENQRQTFVVASKILLVVLLVACKPVPSLPDWNAARKPSQWNRPFLAISTMLKLKWDIQAFKTTEESYTRAWLTNLKLSEERELSVSNWKPL